MKVHLKTLGCRLNEAELEQWSQGFQAAGHEIVLAVPDADVVVFEPIKKCVAKLCIR